MRRSFTTIELVRDARARAGLHPSGVVHPHYRFSNGRTFRQNRPGGNPYAWTDDIEKDGGHLVGGYGGPHIVVGGRRIVSG